MGPGIAVSPLAGQDGVVVESSMDLAKAAMHCWLRAQDRAGGDAELLREYLDHLSDHGVEYGFDEAWRQYRAAAAYLALLPVMAPPTWDAVPERSRQLCLRLVDRAVAAIDEVGALEVFA